MLNRHYTVCKCSSFESQSSWLAGSVVYSSRSEPTGGWYLGVTQASMRKSLSARPVVDRYCHAADCVSCVIVGLCGVCDSHALMRALVCNNQLSYPVVGTWYVHQQLYAGCGCLMISLVLSSVNNNACCVWLQSAPHCRWALLTLVHACPLA